MSERVQMRMATIVIVLVLGLQCVAGAASLQRWSWPFTDYPMYGYSHQEGDRITVDYVIYAKTKDGREVEISPEDIDLNVWLYRDWAEQLRAEQNASVTTPAAAPDGPLREWLKSTRLWELLNSKGSDLSSNSKESDLSSLLLARAERVLGIDIVQLRIEDTPYIVTRHGVAPAPPMPVLVDVSSN